MQTPRPSLNALRAFEATARLKSFTAAAAELSVTHGAVSRHVRALEDTLCLQLLRRSAHSTTPTQDGFRLAAGLSSAFEMIQSSIDQLRPGPLTLSCSESIMMYWLIPRIAGFQQANPRVELRYNMSHGTVDFVRDDIGIAIRLSSIEPPRDALVTKVIDEWVGPVCSAEYIQSSQIQTPPDLARARLLVSRTRPAAWTQWLEASGQVLSDLSIADTFDHFYLLIQAAKCGLGVANVPRMLVRDDLNAGTLVAPFGFVPGPHRLVIWTAPHLSGRPEAHALKEWLTTELKFAEE